MITRERLEQRLTELDSEFKKVSEAVNRAQTQAEWIAGAMALTRELIAECGAQDAVTSPDKD